MNRAATSLVREHYEQLRVRTDIMQYTECSLFLLNTKFETSLHGTMIPCEKRCVPISATAPFLLGSELLAGGMESLSDCTGRFSNTTPDEGPFGAGSKLPLAVVYNSTWQDRGHRAASAWSQP